MSKDKNNDLVNLVKSLTELKALAETASDIFKPISDFEALNSFRAHKASEYFNAAAEKSPDKKIAAKNKAVADMIEKSERLMNKDGELTAKEEALLCKVEAWGEKAVISGEMAKIDDYAASKIAEFVTAQPEVWQRLAKTDDGFVAKAKRLNPGL